MGLLLFVVTLAFVALAVYRGTQFTGWNVVKLRAARGAPFLLLAAISFLAMLSFTTVDAGNVGVIKSFGRPVGQLLAGPHFIRPWAEVVPVTVQTRIVKPNTEASSHDLQVVHTEVTLAYHVDADWATFVLVQLNNDAETRIIDPAILEAIKSVTARYDAQQLVAERPRVRDEIEAFVKERLAPAHIFAETTSITNFDFSVDYNHAIEAKVTAQQNAEKASNDLKRIQIEAEQKIAQAKGEAEALRSQKEQITPELLQLRTIEMMSQKWDGHLPNEYITSGAGALPMMDVLGKRK